MPCSFRLTAKLVLTAALCMPIAASSDPLSGLTLGAALQLFSTQLKEILEKAIGGGLMLEIQAGGQIGVLIQQANAAYQADLDLTYERLNDAERQTVASIRSLLDDYSKQIYSQARDITARAQQTANSLPLAKTFPQLTSFSPGYATQDSNAPVQVLLNGNFVDIGRSDHDARLSVNGHSYKNTQKTTQAIGFEVPLRDLARNPSRVSPNYLDIEIPYEESVLLFFTRTKTAHFSVPLAVLPKHLGTLKLKTTLTKPGVERQTFVSGAMSQESVDDDIICGGEHGDLAMHSVPPDPGWTIVPSSVHWNVTWSQGKQGKGEDWWLEKNCSEVTKACLCISTEHHRAGTSGKVHFTINYVAERPRLSQTTADQVIPLQWGTQKVIETPVGSTWKLAFERFDREGKPPIEIASNYSEALLTISVSGNALTIRTAP